ncbi:HDIG domain-containing metalloprotein [Desulfovulcanus sp.]
MLTRKEAWQLLQSYIQEKNLLYHSLATEAVMKKLAHKLGFDTQLWGITGLVHDLDYPLTKDLPEEHGLKAAAILDGKLPEQALYAIQTHNGEMNGVQPKSTLDFALRCGETVTGLIIASALVRPQKLEGMKVKSLKKKMKDKSFAASVNRQTISECSKIGLQLNDFLALSIDALQAIAQEIGFD